MQVIAGRRLGPYEILTRIGAGGMGEVWRARDTRLERSVAIKILPAEFAASPESRVRFEREARTISQLSHPNICTLYDVGQEDGIDFLVMELLEGESLAERLTRGALALPEVLRYGQQIAEALALAHRQGIVHRDLKPGNVMITRSGAKLLDFGLAKLTDVGVSLDDATVHRPLTREGTIIGTFQYMSPEQLEGEEADQRADIFAFGALLYEMATGRPAFEGKTKTSLIAAIVSSQPRPVSEVMPLAPAALDHVIQKCLEKEREERWQSAQDIAGELRWIGSSGSQAGPAILPRKRIRVQRWLYLTIALLLIALSVLAYRMSTAEQRSLTYRTSIVLQSYPNYYSGPIAISPDDQFLAYAAPTSSGTMSLWTRKFSEGKSQQLAGTGDASAPFWAPDGKFIGYFARGNLLKVSTAGGEPEVITAANEARGGSWNRDGIIIYADSARGSIRRISAGGGESQPVTDAAKLGHHAHLWPLFLPDQKRFLFLAIPAEGSKQSRGIWLASLDSDVPPKFIVKADANAAYVDDGFLLFARDGVVRAQRFSLSEEKVEGESLAITPVQYSARFSSAYFAASNSDALVFIERGSEDLSELVWMDRNGRRLGEVSPPGYFWSPLLSPDGKKVAVDKSATSGDGDIWIFETERAGSMRLTFDPANETAPVWSHDGRSIFFSINPNRTGADLAVKELAGGTARRLVVTKDSGEFPSDLSPDGQTLLIDRNAIATGVPNDDIVSYSLATKTFTPYVHTPFQEGAGLFSPDGTLVVYVSNESGQDEVYVETFPAGRGKWQISNGGGGQPRWSPSGNEIFFIGSDGRFMSAAVKKGAAFETGAPQPHFVVSLRPDRASQYDISPDGQRFLMNVLVRRTDSPMTLITSWRSRFIPD